MFRKMIQEAKVKFVIVDMMGGFAILKNNKVYNPFDDEWVDPKSSDEDEYIFATKKIALAASKSIK